MALVDGLGGLIREALLVVREQLWVRVANEAVSASGFSNAFVADWQLRVCLLLLDRFDLHGLAATP